MEMMWLVFAACRASLRARALSRRLTLLVRFLWSLTRRASCRLCGPVEPPLGGEVAGGGGGDVLDAEVHADEAVRLVLLGLGHVTGSAEVEHAVALDQVGFGLPVRLEHLERVGGAHERHVL
ncbi:hypothetical protein AB0N62_45465 [Streptomyces sp. NPDC093982]|uniref:hypothetical protein n=1 Tax=Streptomyces sp. NPDC093982 TaxID=3155077 RepID=UPI0034212091